MRVVYLHGFASGPSSSKARFFAERFAAVGVDCAVPQLDRGDFANMTVTSQLEAIAETVAEESCALIGSSLGGYLAALYAFQNPEQVERLVLLAPAFGFGTHYPRELGETVMNAWKATGARRMDHYAYNEPRDLNYGFIEDAARYPGEPAFTQPALILHGVNDTVVPPVLSERFAAGRANVRLRILNSDHQLTDVTEILWAEASAFLRG